MNRKEFIEASVRWLMLGTILVFTGLLAYRKRIGPGTGCPVRQSCSNCRESGSCTLPEYKNYLEDEKEKKS